MRLFSCRLDGFCLLVISSLSLFNGLFHQFAVVDAQVDQCPPPYTPQVGSVGPLDYINARQTCQDTCNANGYCCTLGYGGGKNVPCTEGCHIAFFAKTLQQCYDECNTLANDYSSCSYKHPRHADVGNLGFNPDWEYSGGDSAVKKCGGSTRCGCSAEDGWGTNGVRDDRKEACLAGCDYALLQSDMYQLGNLGPDEDYLVFDNRIGFDVNELSQILTDIENHITGTTTFNETQLEQMKDSLWLMGPLIPTDRALIDQAMNLIDIFDSDTSTYGPLFLNSRSVKGFNRVSDTDGKAIERVMLQLHQSMLDELYYGTKQEFQTPGYNMHPPIIKECEDVLQGKQWKTSKYFPGAVTTSSLDVTTTHLVDVDASMNKCWGRPVIFCQEQLIRPTGIYLESGGIAKITVPQSIVDYGTYQMQIGASNANLFKKKLHRRLDRVTTTYDITSTETYVANPLGGNIYLRVPYESDAGVVTLNVTGTGVGLAPFFRQTHAIHNTTESEWTTTLQQAPGSWADIETRSALVQVPRNWMYDYNYEHFNELATNWTKAMDGVSDMFGFPYDKRNNYVMYIMPDLFIRHGVYSVGYPQTNTALSADADGPRSSMFSAKGMDQRFLLTDVAQWAVTYHELGHAQLFTKYKGEGEAAVNLLQVYVKNKVFGIDLDEAFMGSVGSAQFTIDSAAINWMITENFRANNEMDTSGSPYNEVRYQHRGYGKYVDIVRLYGWEVWSQLWHDEHIEYEANGTYFAPKAYGADADDRTYRLSKIIGEDVTPLIEFWGLHPYNRTSLKERMRESNLVVSEKLRHHIEGYTTIVPMNQAAYVQHFDEVYPGKRICHEDGTCNCGDVRFGCGYYIANYPLWNETKAQESINAVYNILSNYPRDIFMYEAETATTLFGCTINNKIDQYDVTGTGFVDYGWKDSYAEWTNLETGSPIMGGRCTIKFRYVAAQNTPRSCDIIMNGVNVGEVPFDRTVSWNDYTYTEAIEIPYCHSGNENTLRLVANSNRGGPNIDHFVIESLGILESPSPTPEPTGTPTSTPSYSPSDIPSSIPSLVPTKTPTDEGTWLTLYDDETLYEAENVPSSLLLSGAIAQDAGTQNVTGSGYIDLPSVGSSIEWQGISGGDIDGGKCNLKFRYQAKQDTPVDVSINGIMVIIEDVVMLSTTPSNGPDAWKEKVIEVNCQVGNSNNVLLTTKGSADGELYIDHLIVEQLVSLYEAEDANTLSGVVEKPAVGTQDVSGTGYVDYGIQGSFIEWNGINGGSAIGGSCFLKFRYAVGQNGPRTCNVIINGIVAGEVTFASSGSWTTWVEDTLDVTSCSQGSNNVIKLVAKTSKGGPNLDYMMIERIPDEAVVSRRQRRARMLRQRIEKKTSTNNVVINNKEKQRLLPEASSRTSTIIGNTNNGNDVYNIVNRPRQSKNKKQNIIKRRKKSIVLDERGNPPGLDRDDILRKNKLSRGKWKNNKTLNYIFEYERDLSVPLELRGPFVIKVLNGQLHSVTYKDTNEIVPSDIIDEMNIPKGFDDIYDDIDKKGNEDVSSMYIEYDDITGLPSSRTVSYLEVNDNNDDEGTEDHMQMDFIRNFQLIANDDDGNMDLCRSSGLKCETKEQCCSNVCKGSGFCK